MQGKGQGAIQWSKVVQIEPHKYWWKILSELLAIMTGRQEIEANMVNSKISQNRAVVKGDSHARK